MPWDHARSRRRADDAVGAGEPTTWVAHATQLRGRTGDRYERFVEVGALLAAGGAAISAVADRATEDAATLGGSSELALRNHALGDAIALPLGTGARAVLL